MSSFSSKLPKNFHKHLAHFWILFGIGHFVFVDLVLLFDINPGLYILVNQDIVTQHLKSMPAMSIFEIDSTNVFNILTGLSMLLSASTILYGFAHYALFPELTAKGKTLMLNFGIFYLVLFCVICVYFFILPPLIIAISTLVVSLFGKSKLAIKA